MQEFKINPFLLVKKGWGVDLMKLEFASMTMRQLKAAFCLYCCQLEFRSQKKPEEIYSQRSLGFQGATSAGSEACVGSQWAEARSSQQGSTPANIHSLNCECWPSSLFLGKASPRVGANWIVLTIPRVMFWHLLSIPCLCQVYVGG